MNLKKSCFTVASLLLFISGLMFSGCAAPTLITLPSPTVRAQNTLLPSATPIVETHTPLPVVEIRPSLTPLPTATPFTYTVVEGDTLLAIAYRYGITLDELMAANPGVEPRLLSVGLVLVVPIEGVIPVVEPTATPFPISIQKPVCYPSMDDGAWCVMQISNEQSSSLENISGWIELFDDQGESLGGKVVFTPLNILSKGRTLSLQAYFPGPLPPVYTAQGSILTALPLAEDDSRYLTAVVEVQVIDISPTSMEAFISGMVILPGEQIPPGVVWVVALAFDEDDQVIGMRKWEPVQPCPDVQDPAQAVSCGPIPFEMIVYSLGPGIQRVEVLVEALSGTIEVDHD